MTCKISAETSMKRFFLWLLVVFFCVLQVNSVYAAETRASEDYLKKYFTSIAAASCVGIYNPDTSREFDYLRNYNWEIEAYTDNDGANVETNFSLAKKYVQALGKQVYVMTFRGSASKNDWRINLKTGKAPYGGGSLAEMETLAAQDAVKDQPAVHRGFNAYTLAVVKGFVLDYNGQLRELFARIRDDENCHLILTGHSLGGAVATLLGERLASLGLPKEKFTVITFGAPAIGNEAFAKEYGDKIELLRITNSQDPVPGSLQTFFSDYRQFGEHCRYRISSKISNVQHDMAMYFDYSVNEYYRAYDAEADAGRIVPYPDDMRTEEIPLVAVWLVDGTGTDIVNSMVDTSRFFAEELKMMLPSRVVMSRHISGKELLEKKFIAASRAGGADYILVCEQGASRAKRGDYHFMLLNCALYQNDGALLSMNSYAKKVTPSIGNIHVTGVILAEVGKELKKQMPFVLSEMSDTAGRL